LKYSPSPISNGRQARTGCITCGPAGRRENRRDNHDALADSQSRQSADCPPGAWNAPMVTMLSEKGKKLLLGGGTAIRRSTFEQSGVMKEWRKLGQRRLIP